MTTELPPWEVLLERCRTRKAEIARLAKTGTFTHESELIDADDSRLAEWAKRIPDEPARLG
ncbi:MAG: hypothetical protein V2A79_10270 [Planctomycetota bacterium]